MTSSIVAYVVVESQDANAEQYHLMVLAWSIGRTNSSKNHIDILQVKINEE
jgi:hypothetical protein